MISYLYKQAIEYDAEEAYEAKDAENLITSVRESLVDGERTLVVLKNAHLLTTKAFSVLYDYISGSRDNVAFALVSSDRDKIFPPLLQLIEPA